MSIVTLLSSGIHQAFGRPNPGGWSGVVESMKIQHTAPAA
jgi:hypothetical protein